MWNILKKDWWIPCIYISFSLLSLVMTIQYYLLYEHITIPLWYKILAGIFGIYQFSSGSFLVWTAIYLPFMNQLAKRWGLKSFGLVLVITQGLLLILVFLLFYPYIQYQFLSNSYTTIKGIGYNVLFSFLIYILLIAKVSLFKRNG